MEDVEEIPLHSSSSRQALAPSLTLTSVSSPLQKAQSFDLGRPNSPTRSSLPRRARSYVSRRFPSFYRHASRVVRYIRGPRPKVDLDDPVPFLQLSVYTGRRAATLALEPLWLYITRPFTAPWILVLLVPAYIISFAFFTQAQFYFTPVDSFIGCTATYWDANDGCGLNGELCAPFNDSTFDFRCPAQCKSVTLANPRTIGEIAVDHVPLVVGGGGANGTYRGDSFVCAAAVHAGHIDDAKGGCASLQLIGNFTDFLSSTANGLTSAPFPTVFPLSFQFFPGTSLTHCTDLRNYGLAFNILVTAALFLVFRPKPIILFWCLVCIGFWHITIFSQPRANPPPLDDAFGDFLPTLFVAYAFWRLAFRFVLPAFDKAPIERAVWYLAAFWPGVLLNIITENIPIDTLTASSIQSEPGGLIAVLVIALVVLFIVINQIRVIRKTGWLPYYLGWYVAGGLVALVLSQLPGLELRLHHYIAAMVLIPGTGFPTRLSAIYQAFLLGMFLNGIAAFGFDSILQTAADLQRDGISGSELPSFITNSTNFNGTTPLFNQTISWNPLPTNGEWDGFALLIDDVERYAGPALNFSLASLQAGLPHFFRLASSGSSGDFTNAATLFSNGTWADPVPGAS